MKTWLKRGGIGAEVFHNLVAAGFQGVVYPVNEKAKVVGSVRAYPRITDIPDEVDLAIIVVPAEKVESILSAPPPRSLRLCGEVFSRESSGQLLSSIFQGLARDHD